MKVILTKNLYFNIGLYEYNELIWFAIISKKITFDTIIYTDKYIKDIKYYYII